MLGDEQTTSHYPNQRWPSSPTHICGTRGDELMHAYVTTLQWNDDIFKLEVRAASRMRHEILTDHSSGNCLGFGSASTVCLYRIGSNFLTPSLSNLLMRYWSPRMIPSDMKYVVRYHSYALNIAFNEVFCQHLLRNTPLTLNTVLTHTALIKVQKVVKHR